jgi:hypothetical protein
MIVRRRRNQERRDLYGSTRIATQPDNASALFGARYKHLLIDDEEITQLAE